MTVLYLLLTLLCFSDGGICLRIMVREILIFTSERSCVTYHYLVIKLGKSKLIVRVKINVWSVSHTLPPHMTVFQLWVSVLQSNPSASFSFSLFITHSTFPQWCHQCKDCRPIPWHSQFNFFLSYFSPSPPILYSVSLFFILLTL